MAADIYLTKLKSLLAPKQQTLPAWFEDLLISGPRFDEWPPVDTFKVNRMFLTELLARWLKLAGLSEQECFEWLELYCCEVLAQYSHSGMSAIRHGTKANVRWVYNSNLRFDFDALAKDPPESGFEGKPPYMSVFTRWWEALYKEKARKRAEYVPPVFEPVVPIKQRFRAQLEKAVAVALQKLEEGMNPGAVVDLLNAQGWLTKTGRKWTRGTLHLTLRNWELDQSRMAAKSGSSAATPKPPNP